MFNKPLFCFNCSESAQSEIFAPSTTHFFSFIFMSHRGLRTKTLRGESTRNESNKDSNQRPTRKATYRLEVEDATEEQSEEGTGARRDTAEDEESDREGAGRKRKRGGGKPERRTLMVTWKRRSHKEKERERGATLAQRESSSARPRPSTSAADQPAEVGLQALGQIQTGLVNLLLG